jgi:superfamily II DNA/RNA helicase
VRILLATDAASEGIDLQKHCHRLVNHDIPFNPNKLEQRIGRIDRYGQTVPPDIRHFIGTGWNHPVDSYEADLEFLARVAIKVSRMEADLGKVNVVLADKMQQRVLGQRVEVDLDAVASDIDDLPTETYVRAQVRRLREGLDQTVAQLGSRCGRTSTSATWPRACSRCPH